MRGLPCMQDRLPGKPLDLGIWLAGRRKSRGQLRFPMSICQIGKKIENNFVAKGHTYHETGLSRGTREDEGIRLATSQPHVVRVDVAEGKSHAGQSIDKTVKS